MNTSEKPYDGETMSGTEENSNVSTEEMLSDVPDTYDYALQVSINPEFILYLVGSEVVAFGTEAVAYELLKEAEDCGISVNPVITIEENLNFLENTMQENIENPEGEKPENHNPATSTAEDFQTSEGEPDESREPQWIEVECSICYGSGRALVKDAVALERKTVTVVEERDLPSAINAVEQHWFHVPIVRLPAVVCVTVVTEPAYVSIVMGQDAGSVIIRVV